MLKLSILISASSDPLLETTLVSILQNRPAACEVVVVHNQGYQDPYDLAGEVRFVLVPEHCDESERLNRGLRVCQAPVIHLLQCGVEVVEGWTTPALRHFANPRVAAVAPLVLAADGQHVEAAGIDYRASGVRVAQQRGRAVNTVGREPQAILGAASMAAFYRATALRQLDPVFSAIVGDRHADVDLALRLASAGTVAMLEPQSQVRLSQPRHVRSPLADAWHAERLFWRHLPATGRAGTVVKHLGMIAVEAAGSLLRPLQAGRVIGRGAGWAEQLLFGKRLGGYSDRVGASAIEEADAEHSTGPATLPMPTGQRTHRLDRAA